MKKHVFFTTMVLLVAYLLSACGGTLQPVEQQPGDQAALKVRAVEVAFTGVVEAINGSEWTVNGNVLSVDPAVVRDGPFQVGDTVKVEGTVNADGSFSISRVEAPSPAELAELPQLGNDNANANSNDDNSNDGNANANFNDDNTNGANLNANSNDDNSNDANANSNDDGGTLNGNNNNDDDGGNSNGDDGGDDDDDNDNNSGSDDSGGNSNDDDD